MVLLVTMVDSWEVSSLGKNEESFRVFLACVSGGLVSALLAEPFLFGTCASNMDTAALNSAYPSASSPLQLAWVQQDFEWRLDS